MNLEKELSEMTLEELWQLFPIILTEHRDEWSAWYAEAADELMRQLTGFRVEHISHIGSTAIRGIMAKPIVDILIELEPGEDMRAVAGRIEAAGWLRMSEGPGRISLNRGYTKHGFAEKVFHLHLRFAGDNDELYFRDYMNEHAGLAAEYEALKLSLWKKYEHDRDAYTQAKTAFIRENTERALCELKGKETKT